MGGGWFGTELFGRIARALIGHIGRVRFRREGQICDRLRQGQFTLGTAQPFIGLPRLQANRLRLRVGQPDVFHGHAGDATGEKTRVFAALQHAGKPIKRGIRVRSTHRLVQRGNQIVMLFAGFVVFRGPLHQPFGQRVAGDFTAGFPCRDLFDQVQQCAPVAIRHFQKRLAGITVKRQGAAQILLGALCQPFQISQIKPRENQHLTARQHRGVQLKAGVFGGRPDQQDGAVFHIGQKPVLLCFVETVDFVDKQQGAFAVLASYFGGLEDFAQLRHAGKNRADLHKVQIGFRRKQTRDRGFANPGWTPENKRAKRAGGQHNP